MLLLLFFKQKTAYEMRISDWSSDVCSSDLPALIAQLSVMLPIADNSTPCTRFLPVCSATPSMVSCELISLLTVVRNSSTSSDNASDRKSVVSGKSCSLRVDLGGRRIIKKKNNT